MNGEQENMRRSISEPGFYLSIYYYILPKYRAWAIYKRTSRILDFDKFKKLRNASDRIVKTAQRDYEKALISTFKKEPKKLYSYLRDKMRIKEGVAQMERVNGDLTKSDEETATVLNDFFTSVYTKEPDAVLPEFEDKLDEIGHVTDVNITEEKVRSKLKQLKENKSPGPDAIHPRVLKECFDEFAKPLCLLFRKSLDEGNLPLDRKEVNVTPIHKKGPKTSPRNYRPVSLTSIPCKILENLIKEQIQE